MHHIFKKCPHDTKHHRTKERTIAKRTDKIATKRPIFRNFTDTFKRNEIKNQIDHKTKSKTTNLHHAKRTKSTKFHTKFRRNCNF